MKIVFLGLVCIILSACHSEITRPQLNTLQDKCATHGGIYRIDTVISPSAICYDGTFVDTSKK